MNIETRTLSAALRDWAGAIGAGNVLCDAALLSQAETATFTTTSKIGAILRPGSRAEVQECVRVANRHRVPIYPISTGKNWGYGSRAPVRDGVLLDLGRLNRIVEFDEDLAYVTVEPGVTQRQLHQFLSERGSRLWMDATGASPDCSIVGNTMERGFGHTPLGDHCANVCGFEVVLPDGACVETGFRRFGAHAGPVSRWGVGPSLDGLFSQSNFGIVTRMTVWLMRAPEAFEAFFFMCASHDDLAGALDALRPLRLDGTLRSTAHIVNDYKVLVGTSQYPWAAMDGRTPIGSADMQRIRKQYGIGSWNGSAALYGSRGQVRAAKQSIRRALKGKVSRLQFVDDRLIANLMRFATPFKWITGWDVRRTMSLMKPAYDLMKGIPTDATLASAYWRKRQAPPASPDPDRDGCGLLWCSPVVPNTGRDAIKISALTTQHVLEHGFEPQISISMASERSLICVISLSYDRDVPGEDARAMTCYRTLTSNLLSLGYPPYRVNVESMDLLDDRSPYAKTIRDLKAALDPNGILAPGRYEPAPHDQRGRTPDTIDDESLVTGAV